MPEILAAVADQPGLGWLAVVALIAGVVRGGFTGFGTALIYMPVAGGQFLSPPFGALITLTAMDVIGPLPNLPRAFRDGHRRDALRLCAGGLAVAMPLGGVWVLTLVAPEVFRYSVSLLSLGGLLALLVSGWRYHGELRRAAVYLVGMLGGFLGGGATGGLAGPPVIMTYMASPHPAKVIRANLLLYLFGVDVLMIGGVLTVMGRMEPASLVLGFALAVPYLAGNLLGGAGCFVRDTSAPIAPWPMG